MIEKLLSISKDFGYQRAKVTENNPGMVPREDVWSPFVPCLPEEVPAGRTPAEHLLGDEWQASSLGEERENEKR